MRRILARISVALLSLSCAGAKAGREGAVVRIPDDPSCPRCVIALRAVTTLSVPVDTADGLPTAVLLDSRSRTWVFREGEAPALFDAQGRFLRTLGRTGRGPGEYEMPWYFLPMAHDSVMVLEAQSRRGTVLDPELHPIRFVRLPPGLGSPIVVSWPDTIIGSGSVPLQEAAGPIHRFSFESGDGVVAASFRPGGDAIPDEMLLYSRHEFSAPSDGRFWSIWSMRYDVTQWSAEGASLRALERRPEWFPGLSPWNYDWRHEPPPPHAGGIAEDGDGLLWVYVRVAAPTWREAFVDIPPGVGEYDPRHVYHEKLYRTAVEVIDPRRARVVARTFIDRYFVSALPGARAAFYEVSDDGTAHVAIVRLALQRH